MHLKNTIPLHLSIVVSDVDNYRVKGNSISVKPYRIVYMYHGSHDHVICFRVQTLYGC